MEIKTYDLFWYSLVGLQVAQKALIFGVNTIV